MVSDCRVRLKAELECYQSEFQIEHQFKGLMLKLLLEPDCFKRSSLHAHFTASAWVLNHKFDKALLTHHAKLSRWLQLGGHADGEEDLRIVAQKELNEESGLSNASFIHEEIFDIDIHTIPARRNVPEHEHYDVRFLFIADQFEQLNKNHESKEVAWVSLDLIPGLCNQNDSILRMIKKSESMKIKMSS